MALGGQHLIGFAIELQQPLNKRRATHSVSSGPDHARSSIECGDAFRAIIASLAAAGRRAVVGVKAAELARILLESPTAVLRRPFAGADDGCVHELQHRRPLILRRHRSFRRRTRAAGATAKTGDRWAAFEPLRQRVRQVFGRFAKSVAHGLRILGDRDPYSIAKATILGNREAGRNRDDTNAAHHRGPTRDGRIE